MTRVAMVHSYWEALGGAERLAQQTIVALNSRGIVPDLYTMRALDGDELAKTFGKAARFNPRTVSVLDLKLPKFVLYQILLHTIITNLIISNYDVVVNTTGSPVFTSLASRIKRQIVYIHSPVPNPFQIRDAPLYYWPYLSYMVRSVRLVRTSPSAKFLCNSNFTKERLRKNWNVDATTIYPPVDLDRFRITQSSPREGVVTVGRFVKEKNHLEQLAIARRLPGVKFKICGTAKKRTSMRWLNRVREVARDLANVTVHVNIPFDQLRSMIWGSKVFLHTMRGEDFGISTVEAVMGGCVPIVADSGGCKETVPYDELRFKSTDEAQEKIMQALQSKFDHLLPQLNEYAIANFSEERFRNQMLDQILND